MKQTLYTTVILALLLIASCSKNLSTSQGEGATPETPVATGDTIRIANDSLEYELIVIEPGFYGWLTTQPPRGYYSKFVMENSNRIDVTEYNIRVRNPMQYDQSIYPFEIEYRRDVDYGYEVNYLLYNYFIFFKQKYRQRFGNPRGRI